MRRENSTNPKDASRFLLRLAQSVWLLIVISTVLLVLVAIPARFAQLDRVVPQLEFASGTLGEAEAQVLAQLGIPVSFYAGYVTFLETLAACVGILVGVIIFRQRRHDGMALFASLALVTINSFVTPLMTAVLYVQPVLASLVTLLQCIAIGSSFLNLYLIPDGRFVPRWTRVPAFMWVAYSVVWLLVPALKPPLTLFSFQTASVAVLGFMLAIILIGVYAQIYRYRHESTAGQRQQTKWIVFGFGITFALWISLACASLFVTFIPPTRASMLFFLSAVLGLMISFFVQPVTVMFSILKFRLWDIDILIRRTLTYSLVTALLVIFYFGSVILLQRALFLSIGAPQNELVTVLSTLAIAALFVPLRNRIQQVIDRHFYRRKYDAQQVLAQFAATARDETNLERLTGQLIEVVNETMQPTRLSLWLKKETAKKRRT